MKFFLDQLPDDRWAVIVAMDVKTEMGNMTTNEDLSARKARDVAAIIDRGGEQVDVARSDNGAL